MPGVAFDCLALSFFAVVVVITTEKLDSTHFSLFNLGTWYAMRVTNTTNHLYCPTRRRDPFNDNNDDDVVITRISDAAGSTVLFYISNYSPLIND